MKSGMLAAETAYAALHPTLTSSTSSTGSDSESPEPITSDVEGPLDMSAYETAVTSSFIWEELTQVRNLRPSFHNPLGLWGGMAYSGLDSLILRGRVPWTFRNKIEDYAHTKKAS
jgi:electron-transferring-flavoprotein dehydrogenase